MIATLTNERTIMANVKDNYERKFLELLLRHELPAECEVQIEVKPKSSRSSGKTVFVLTPDAVTVRADLESLNLRRAIPPQPCW